MAEKDQIADIFQKYFNHFGFKKTSVDDVARELHISKKTIYQYFSTKEEVFYYVISRIARQYRARMEAELDGIPTYRGKVEHLVRMIFSESRKWVKENDAFEFKYKYEIAELAFQDTYAELIAELVQKGIEQGEFPPLPVETTARFIRGIISEGMELLMAHPERKAEEEVIAAVLKLLR
jgi:AcrR family transcriptional regulator